MKYLGIDYGEKRIGVAISSKDEKIVTPYKTIINSSRQKVLTQLIKIMEQEKIEGVVIGLPLNLEGEETLITRQIRNFVKELKKRISIPIHFMDEAYSSYDAESKLRKAGFSYKKIKQIIDQVAAQDILITFLQSRNNE